MVDCHLTHLSKEILWLLRMKLGFEKFGNQNVDNFMSFWQVFLIQETIVKTTLEKLNVQQHSFYWGELCLGKSKDIVSEQIEWIEAVVLWFKLL